MNARQWAFGACFALVVATLSGCSGGGGGSAMVSSGTSSVQSGRLQLRLRAAAGTSGLTGLAQVSIHVEDATTLHDVVPSQTVDVTGQQVNVVFPGLPLTQLVVTVFGLDAHGNVVTSATSSPFELSPVTVTTVSLTLPPIAVGAPAQLVFLQTPANSFNGQALFPLQVAVEDANGQVVTSDTSQITLAIATNNGAGILRGTVTLSAQNGVATFNNVSINNFGSYSLTATDGTLAPATTAIFTVTGVPGALSEIQSQASGAAPNVIGLSPAGDFLAVPDFGSGNVATYQADTVTGLLGAATFTTTGGNPTACIFSPLLNTFYTSVATTQVQAPFDFNAATGVVTPLTTAPSDQNPLGQAVTADGKFLYCANLFSNTVTAYQIQADGSLAVIKSFATGAGPVECAITPNGQFLYTANTSSTISAFQINADGTLTSLGDTPSVVSTATTLAISPSGQFLYVPGIDSNNIQVFSIAANGSLTAVGTPVSTGTGPNGIRITFDGAFLYTTDARDVTVSGFQVNAVSGALTPIQGSPFTGATNAREAAIAPSDNFIYVASDGDNSIKVFGIAPPTLVPGPHP